MCGQWRHGERGRWGWLCFGIGLFSLFPSPSCGFMAYLPVADFHLAMRGDLWQICCRDFCQGLQEERDLQQGSCAGPDDPGGGNWGNLTPLGGPLRCEP